jgi:hypothetical protein
VAAITLEQRPSVQAASEHRHSYVESEDTQKSEANHELGTIGSSRQDSIGKEATHDVCPVVTEEDLRPVPVEDEKPDHGHCSNPAETRIDPPLNGQPGHPNAGDCSSCTN